MPSRIPLSRENDLASNLSAGGEGVGPYEGLVPPGGAAAVVKAAFDSCLAVLLLVVAAPLVLVCAVLVRLTSRGPAFYSQLRLGVGGRPYWIFKLRTMYHRCEEKSGPRWSQKGDPRVTPVGRFLRRTHLDELPQLWNILRGEMSLVGPRPERPEFAPKLADAVPLYGRRLLVRPGVTGLAQVQLPADSDLEGVRIKVAYDLYYIRNGGLWLDLRILLATALKVFGAPFRLIFTVCRFPERSAVENGYRDLQQRAATAEPEAPVPAPPVVAARLFPAQ
jgi:lipopolysaccharide/colanic/teichoic acid biosynthesis glycosyltransferase